ncbi:helix-turn-helix domain-containing protein [Kitasatospora sp. NPDC048365]|uniref:helix-turn-helix domain-containing protein n=1 Tax=Kitasatospora sp. NPDC048365 TaxID=3364050 RepID=UPI00371E30E5
MNHSQWKPLRTGRLLGEEGEESLAFLEAGYAFASAKAVYDRRTELGLSQAELTRCAGMAQPQISDIEGAARTPVG